MKHCFLSKMLAIVLVLSLVVCSGPIQVFAVDEVPEDERWEEKAPDSQGYSAYLIEETEAIVVTEDSSRRELEIKHFRMSDSSSTAAVFLGLS